RRAQRMLAFTAESIESCGAGEARDTHRPGALAQLVERLLCKQDVRSSNLLGSTTFRRRMLRHPSSSFPGGTALLAESGVDGLADEEVPAEPPPAHDDREAHRAVGHHEVEELGHRRIRVGASRPPCAHDECDAACGEDDEARDHGSRSLCRDPRRTLPRRTRNTPSATHATTNTTLPSGRSSSGFTMSLSAGCAARPPGVDPPSVTCATSQKHATS